MNAGFQKMTAARDDKNAARNAEKAQAEMTREEVFWAGIRLEFITDNRVVDARGRLTAVGAERMAGKKYEYGVTLGGTANFDNRVRELLFETATVRVAAAKAKVAGIGNEIAKDLPALMAAINDAVRRLASSEGPTEKLRARMREAGINVVADVGLPYPGSIARTVADLQGMLAKSKVHTARAIETARAKEEEILAWPEPSLEDLSTLYVGTPMASDDGYGTVPSMNFKDRDWAYNIGGE